MPKVADHRIVLGAAIRQQRKRAGLSLERLAEKANLHHNYLARVERGEEHLSLSALIRVAKALHITVSELVRELERAR